MSESYPSSITRLDSPTLITFESLPFSVPSIPSSLMKHTGPGLRNTIPLLWQASRHGSVRDYIQNLTPSKAPPVMTLLDQYLQQASPDDALRCIALSLLRHVAQSTGLLPEKLKIKDVQWNMSDLSETVGNADVYKGRRGCHIDVAVRHVRLSKTDLKLFYTEATTWAYLRHDHILPLLGVIIFPKQRSYPNLVSPWVYEGKTLKDFVRAPDQWKSYEDQCYRIASGVAQGLAYLHSHQIVHGDINDTNIIIDEYGQSLIGYSGPICLPDAPVASAIWNLLWMAPEQLAGCLKGVIEKTRAMDVYAYARVCAMVYNRGPVYSRTADPEEIMALILQGHVPELPQRLFGSGSLHIFELWRVCQLCWHPNPDYRLSMPNILAFFKYLPSKVTPSTSLFRVQARDPGDYVPTDGLEFPTQKKQWIEILDCISDPKRWVTRAMPEGTVGYIVNPDKRLHNAVLCRVRMRATEIDPMTGSNPILYTDPGDNIVEIYAFGVHHWLARTRQEPRRFGYISLKEVEAVYWPQFNPQMARQCTVMFGYTPEPGMRILSPSLSPGDRIQVISHYPNDEWLMAYDAPERPLGIIPANYVWL